jgi:hypothetical protein
VPFIDEFECLYESGGQSARDDDRPGAVDPSLWGEGPKQNDSDERYGLNVLEYELLHGIPPWLQQSFRGLRPNSSKALLPGVAL